MNPSASNVVEYNCIFPESVLNSNFDPFSNYTDIVFEHNQQGVEFATRAEIYSITGQLVRVIEQSDPQNGSVSTPVRWDGHGNNGSPVAPGVYFYNLIVRTSNGLNARSSGKMIYKKE